MLFKSFERIDPTPCRYQEPTFDFYERHKSTAAARVRETIHTWLAGYPAELRAELCARFRVEFESALYELFLHELFKRQGTAVRVHPDRGDKGKRPDFEVITATGSVIVEATICNDDAGDRNPNQDVIYDVIDSVACPDFFILVRESNLESGKNPAVRRLRAFLDREIERLDADSLLWEAESSLVNPSYPTRSYEDDGVMIEFEFVPRKRHARGRVGVPNIGMTPVITRWGNGFDTVRDTLAGKAKKYGVLDEPFVIAVNVLSPWICAERDSAEVLFGTKQEYVSAGGLEVGCRVLDDGFWGTAEHPKWTRVSGVILGSVYPTSFARAKLWLVHNPWARHPIPADFWCLPSMRMIGADIVRAEGTRKPSEILGLDELWPGDLFEDLRSSAALAD